MFSGSSTVSPKVLVVDDEPLIRVGLERLLAKEGYSPLCAGSGSEALDILGKEETLFLVLLDLKLPGALDGLAILKSIKKSRPELTVIMVSGQSEIHVAVEAMKLGATDYLEKPIDLTRLKNLLSCVRQEAYQKSTGAKTGPPGTCREEPACNSSKMKKVLDLMRRLAVNSDLPILFTGESGSGKSYLAQKLHEMSPRRDRPFVQFSCAHFADRQIENDLFGCEKDAPTGTGNPRRGLVEIADGGTILIDELEKMPCAFQPKFLRLLEEKRFRRRGSPLDMCANTTILAATTSNLHAMAEMDQFNLDLFYLLNTTSIEVPPLRERADDVPLLVDTFLECFTRKYGSPSKKVSAEGMAIMKRYCWPGNVRQLKNMIEKLVVLSEKNEISAEEISLDLLSQQQNGSNMQVPKQASGENDNNLSLEAMERKHINAALKLTGGNQRKAARLLSISRDTLRYRLKKFGIEP